MMTVRLRLAALVARWCVAERHRPPAAVSRLEMRCLPTDCDVNGHMNNSRYLALMDLGRYHFVLTTGLWREMWRRRWFPVLARAAVDFRASLKPGDRFVLETRLEAVGSKRAELRQRFYKGDTLVADGLATGVFLHQGKPQPLAELMADPAYAWIVAGTPAAAPADAA